MAKRDIILLGGSAGSNAVLKQLMAAMPADFRGSLFVTTHIPSTHPSYLPDLLASAGPLPVTRAVDGQPVEPGRVYVAAPDRHLLLVEGVVRLGAGPRENMVRPSIDPMVIGRLLLLMNITGFVVRLPTGCVPNVSDEGISSRVM